MVKTAIRTIPNLSNPLKNDYDVTQDEVFNKFSNTKMPDDIDIPTSSVAAFTGSFGKDEAKHLLARTLFGFKKTTWQTFSNKTLSQAVDDLLNINTAIVSAPKDYRPMISGIANPDYGKEWINLPYNPSQNFIYRRSLSYWWVGNITNHDDTILEKMTMFWHNHFATESEIIGRAEACFDYCKLIRDNALGNFKDLVLEITKNVGMLRYLNGVYNTKNAPDENYARELMELFTLGKGADSQYTESDVKAAARVLTGWKINSDWRSSFFNKGAHDTNNKLFSPFFSNTIIQGKNDDIGGAQETSEMINMIFTKEDVIAKYMVREFYKFFVYYNITPSIEANVIGPLAAIFKTNWEVKPVIEALLKSEHFYDVLNQGCFIKTPMDIYGNLVHNLEAVVPKNTIEREYLSYEVGHNLSTLMGMTIGNPPSVAGWPAFYQEPKFHEIWINSDTYPKRVQYSVFLAFDGINVKDSSTKFRIDIVKYAESLGADAADPNKLIDLTCEFLLGVDISKASKDKIKLDVLTANIPSDAIWTTGWNDYINDPTDAAKKQSIFIRLLGMFKYIFELPEYQLC